MKTRQLSLNLQFFADEKTEKATPRKKKEAREKGQVAKSAELSPALIILFVFLILSFFAGPIKSHLQQVFILTFSEFTLMDLNIENIQVIFLKILWIGVQVLAPILVVALIIGVVSNYIQVGFLFTGEPLKINLSKLDPIKGFKRIVSLRAIVEMAKSILKISIVSLVVFSVLWGEKEKLLILSRYSIPDMLAYVGGLTLKMGIYVAILLCILAIFDYMYQRFEHNKNLRMSKQDIKDEFKKTEGDPLIKSKIRERQRQMAVRRMMQEVPKADVVITNPTHFSVAIKYEAGKMNAPMVIAKGQDYIALKIRELAKEHGVILMENKPLARAIYQRVDIGESIPEDLFKAVAEVLAFVYRTTSSKIK